MSIQQRIRSIQYAVNGFSDMLKTQPNVRIHLFVSALVTIGGFYYHISKADWIAVVICMALVLGLEALNTAVEYCCDLVSPEYHPLAGKAKDAAAAAVLIAAMGAVVVGIIVFGPLMLEEVCRRWGK
jgi:diacylglycerol kinase